MASTYSTSLKLQLMATGENSTTWGDVTNVNLGTALEEAITGTADVTFASGDVTLTMSDTNATQTARHLRLDCVGTTGGATRNLTIPSEEKVYIVDNNCADAIKVKTSISVGIDVPAGKTMWLFCDGTNVIDVVTHLSSLTLGSALPVASGGSGQTSYTDGQLLIGNTTGNTLDKATLTGGTGVTITNGSGTITIAADNNGSVTSVDVSGGTTGLTTSGGPVTSSGTITLAGTLAVANGGTNATDAAGARTSLGAAASGANTDITALDQDVTVTATGTIAADSIGYRGVPQNSQTGAYQLVLADAGKHISITTGGITIPANSGTAFPVGTTIAIFNNSGSSQTIAITSDTLRQAGTANTGSRTLGQYGLATCVKVASTTWVISGAGLS